MKIIRLSSFMELIKLVKRRIIYFPPVDILSHFICNFQKNFWFRLRLIFRYFWRNWFSLGLKFNHRWFGRIIHFNFSWRYRFLLLWTIFLQSKSSDHGSHRLLSSFGEFNTQIITLLLLSFVEYTCDLPSKIHTILKFNFSWSIWTASLFGWICSAASFFI